VSEKEILIAKLNTLNIALSLFKEIYNDESPESMVYEEAIRSYITAVSKKINNPKYTSDTDQQTAAEMEAISAMLTIARQHGLEAEIIYSILLNIKAESKDIADACANAVCEWVK